MGKWFDRSRKGMANTNTLLSKSAIGDNDTKTVNEAPANLERRLEEMLLEIERLRHENEAIKNEMQEREENCRFLKGELFSKNEELRRQELQLQQFARRTEQSITSCAPVFIQQNLLDLCLETAKAIKGILLFDQQNNEKNKPSLNPLSIRMALVNNGDFIEIINENQNETYQYLNIVYKMDNSNDKSILYSIHSLDILFYSGNILISVLHADGIDDGFSPCLQNSIRCAYNSISVALSNLETRMDMEEIQENVFIKLAEIVEQRTLGTGGHLKNVSLMAGVFCDRLQISSHEKHILTMASMVHDIGKLAIPESIIEKKGKLTDEEYQIMQDHVIYGYNIMSKAPGEFMSAAAVIAQQHHEKYDGTGYLEFRGEQIHLYARVVAIIDVFDALLSDRPYKESWPAEQACAYIQEQAGKHFDPDLVNTFNLCKNDLIAVRQENQ